MIARILLSPLAALFVAVEPAVPQPAPVPSAIPQSQPLDARARRSVIDAASRVMIDGYVYEDRARDFASKLGAKLEQGRYDAITDRREFARAVTGDLLEMSGDKHLRVLPDSVAAAYGGGPRFVRAPVPVGPAGAARGARVMGPAGPVPRRVAVPEGGPVPHTPGGRTLPNDGFARIEILDGGVGYVDLRGFQGTESGLARADSMMKAFAGVKALVIDLGKNGGGDGMMVQHLSTYLFDRPTLLAAQQWRGEERPLERWTLEAVPGPRLARVPVYVLTSGRTFSAAESFAFGLKNNDRITIVGEKTGGGGHFGRVEPLGEGLSLWLPHGRTYDPRTGKGWEAAGIEPDVAVPYEQALEKALGLARGARP